MQPSGLRWGSEAAGVPLALPCSPHAQALCLPPQAESSARSWACTSLGRERVLRELEGCSTSVLSLDHSSF